MLLGLATELAEILEFFLNELSALCGEITIGASFWTHPGIDYPRIQAGRRLATLL